MVIIDPTDIWRSLLRTLVPPRSQPKPHWLHHHNRFVSLLTATPLRLSGAVGSPVTLVATV